MLLLFKLVGLNPVILVGFNRQPVTDYRIRYLQQLLLTVALDVAVFTALTSSATNVSRCSRPGLNSPELLWLEGLKRAVLQASLWPLEMSMRVGRSLFQQRACFLTAAVATRFECLLPHWGSSSGTGYLRPSLCYLGVIGHAQVFPRSKTFHGKAAKAGFCISNIIRDSR